MYHIFPNLTPACSDPLVLLCHWCYISRDIMLKRANTTSTLVTLLQAKCRRFYQDRTE